MAAREPGPPARRVRTDRRGGYGRGSRHGLGADARGAARGDAAGACGEARVQPHRGEEKCGVRACPGAARDGQMTAQTLTITRPDDWHLHLRDGPEMASVLPYTARVFQRAV